MISKGTTISYGDYIEVYRCDNGGLGIWYRRDTFGPEWPSMSFMLILGAF